MVSKGMASRIPGTGGRVRPLPRGNFILPSVLLTRVMSADTDDRVRFLFMPNFQPFSWR